jgi:hypothetical protein
LGDEGKAVAVTPSTAFAIGLQGEAKHEKPRVLKRPKRCATNYEENGEVGGASCLSTLVFDPLSFFFNFFISFFAFFIIFFAFFISFFAFFDLSFLVTANLLRFSPDRKPRQLAELMCLSRTSIARNARGT